MTKPVLLSLCAAVLFTGCATIPTGPSVIVLPGSGKPFDQFQVDDAACRQWASQQVGQSYPDEAQRRYDIAFQQCMYAKGHQIPAVMREARPSRYPPPPPPAQSQPPSSEQPSPSSQPSSSSGSPPGYQPPPPGAQPPPAGTQPPPDPSAVR
jgi:hypothetical protein